MLVEPVSTLAAFPLLHYICMKDMNLLDQKYAWVPVPGRWYRENIPSSLH